MQAIQAINPSAEFVLRDSNDDIDIDNETFTIEWHKGSAISKTDIKAKIDEIQPLETVYKNRQKEYPNHEDCIHALLDGGDTLTDLQAKRTAIKEKYPKE